MRTQISETAFGFSSQDINTPFLNAHPFATTFPVAGFVTGAAGLTPRWATKAPAPLFSGIRRAAHRRAHREAGLLPPAPAIHSPSTPRTILRAPASFGPIARIDPRFKKGPWNHLRIMLRLRFGTGADDPARRRVYRRLTRQADMSAWPPDQPEYGYVATFDDRLSRALKCASSSIFRRAVDIDRGVDASFINEYRRPEFRKTGHRVV